MAPATIMPPTGTTTRAWVEITPSSTSTDRVAAVAAATPIVAARRACGRPAPRRPATCPAMTTMTATQASAPGNPVCANTISRIAPTAASWIAARAVAASRSRVNRSRCR